MLPIRHGNHSFACLMLLLFVNQGSYQCYTLISTRAEYSLIHKFAAWCQILSCNCKTKTFDIKSLFGFISIQHTAINLENQGNETEQAMFDKDWWISSCDQTIFQTELNQLDPIFLAQFSFRVSNATFSCKVESLLLPPLFLT